MKRLVAVVALLLSTAACTARRDDTNAAFERAQETYRAGDTATALSVTDDALARLNDADDSLPAWRLRLLRAEILIVRRDFAHARPLLQRAVPEAERLAVVRARQRYLDARLALASNDLQRTLSAVAEARALAPEEADVQIDIDLVEGAAELARRAWETAEVALTRGLDRALQRGDQYRQLLCLNNLGLCRLSRGHYDEALTFFERALAMSTLEKTTVYAQLLSNSGICYSRLGQFDRALDVQQKAVAALRARGNSKAVVEALGSLGNTHVLKGDPRGALPFLN